MSGFKGTPGPWMANGEERVVNETLMFCGDVTPVPDGIRYRGDIASIQSCNHIGPHGISRAEAAANARLIAAAPELLEACLLARHICEDGNALQQQIDAAIAKATGGQP